jgi:hypothetical protein
MPLMISLHLGLSKAKQGNKKSKLKMVALVSMKFSRHL